MRALIVNLARMGDLVQTTPTARALVQAGYRVDLLVNAGLRGFAQRLDGVDEVLGFDLDELGSALLRPDQHSLVEIHRLWREWLDSTADRDWDLLINLTHDEFSARLVPLLAPRARLRGRHALGGEAFAVEGAWARYFYSALDHRRLNGFNLADIHRRMPGGRTAAADVRMQPTPEDLRSVSKLLGAGEAPVMIHPGAKHPARRWAADRYARLAADLLRAGRRVALVGGPDDRPLAQQIRSQVGPELIDLVAATSLETLPALLAGASLLISGDTGPLHVAAAVGRPTLSIYLAMARPEDTAPAAPGHWIVETMHPDHPCDEHNAPDPAVDGDVVPVKLLTELALARLAGEDPLAAERRCREGAWRLLETRRDAYGDIEIHEIARHGSSRTLGEEAKQLRPFWRALLDGDDELPAEQKNPLARPENWPALQRAQSLLAALTGRLAGDPDQPSIATLESAWLELEGESGDLGALLRIARLEREAIYNRGVASARRELPVRLERMEHWLGKLSVCAQPQGAGVAP